MSLIGRRPVIQKSGEAASSSVAHSATPNVQLPACNTREDAEEASPTSVGSRRARSATAVNKNHAATMQTAPPAADQIASAHASAATPVRAVDHSAIGSEMCPSST